MSACRVSVWYDQIKVEDGSEVPGENNGRTTHVNVLSKMMHGETTVRVRFDEGYGVLFLWYAEIIV